MVGGAALPNAPTRLLPGCEQDRTMPNLVHRLPQARLHKPSGQARVRICGRDVYLGRFGSPEARAAYERLLADYLRHGRTLRQTRDTPTTSPRLPSDLSVAELIRAYWDRHVTSYYRKDGKPTG